MKNSKIIRHATYTYETTDGREFDDDREAEEWQETLSIFDTIYMLDSREQPTKDIGETEYVRFETEEQVKAYNAIVSYNCYCALAPGVGFYRYDDRSDAYIDVKSEIENLQHIIDILSKGDTDEHH